MKKLKLLSKILMAGALMMLTTHLFAQAGTTQALTMGIPAISLIQAVDTNAAVAAVSLQLTTTIAGDQVTGGTGTSFAQVSSIVGSGQSRIITVSSTTVPAGTTLDVTGLLPWADAGGVLGSPATATNINGTAQTVFSGIGSCYTGTGKGDGYVFHWKWNAGSAANYGLIVATAGSTTSVTITISAAS